MVFAVISFAPHITPVERERAAAGAPPFTASPTPYPGLLEEAGWKLEDRIDVTAALSEICRRELAAFEARADRLRELLGESDFSERLAFRRAKIAGIQEGLIRREIFVTHPRGG